MRRRWRSRPAMASSRPLCRSSHRIDGGRPGLTRSSHLTNDTGARTARAAPGSRVHGLSSGDLERSSQSRHRGRPMAVEPDHVYFIPPGRRCVTDGSSAWCSASARARAYPHRLIPRPCRAWANGRVIRSCAGSDCSRGRALRTGRGSPSRRILICPPPPQFPSMPDAPSRRVCRSRAATDESPRISALGRLPRRNEGERICGGRQGRRRANPDSRQTRTGSISGTIAAARQRRSCCDACAKSGRHRDSRPHSCVPPSSTCSAKRSSSPSRISFATLTPSLHFIGPFPRS